MKHRAILLLVASALFVAACSDGIWNELDAGDCVEEDGLGGLLNEADLSIVNCDNLETDTHVYLVYWKGSLAELDQPTEVDELAYCQQEPSATFVSNDDEAVCYINRRPPAEP
ncbi:MAG: hypothetical protein ACC652_13005 [Acidimicrobiales bacterium]